jgi:hypothetical protein
MEATLELAALPQLFDGAAYELGMVPVEKPAEPLQVRGIVGMVPATTGLYEVKIPGLHAEPKAAIFIATLTTAEDGSFAANRGQAVSFTAGFGQHVGAGVASRDAVGTTNASRVGQNVAPVFFAGLVVGVPATLSIAGFATWVPGGVRLNWLISPATQYRFTAIFFFGDDLQAAAGTATPGATTDPDVSVSVGFKPDVLLAVNALEFFAETFESSLALNLGMAVRDPDDDSAEEYGLFVDSEDVVATSNVRALQYQDGVAQGLVSDTLTFRKTHVVAFDATGFDIRSVAGSDSGTTAGPTLGYLALYLAGKKYDVRPHSTGASTGLVSFSGLDFKPQALLALGLAKGNTSWADHTIDLIGGGGANGVAFADEDGFQAWNGQREEDGVATTEAKSQLHATRAFHLPDHQGTDRFLAELDSFEAGGFVLDVLTLTDSPHALLVLTIEEGVATVTFGELAASAPQPSFAGTGEEEFAGTLAGASAPQPTFSGTGTLEFVGTLAASAPEPTFSGTGELVFEGTLGASAPQPTFAGTGAIAFIGTLGASAPQPSLEATGELVFIGTAGASAPQPTFEATGLLVFVGTLGASAPQPTFEGAGEVVADNVTGALAATAPQPAFSGAGLLVFVGELAATAPRPTFLGTGLYLGFPLESFTELLATYTPAAALQGTHLASSALLGTYLDGTGLLGTHVDAADLEGSHLSASALEGAL